MNRRQFLSAAAVSAAGILFPDEAFALADNSGFWRRDRLLEMRRADTASGAASASMPPTGVI